MVVVDILTFEFVEDGPLEWKWPARSPKKFGFELDRVGRNE
jgi:hypothetical protein